MIYLDTNVIIYPIEKHEKYEKACTKILLDIESGKLEACSSMPVLTETITVLLKLNKILKEKGEPKINVKGSMDAILSLPITWFDLNFPAIKLAAGYDYNISGGDYIHVAIMEINGIKKIISADEDLDKVDVIKRIDPLDY